MTPFFVALALMAQSAADTPAAVAEIPVPAATEDRIPNGAPRDDYPFVAWCYGALRGYLDMKAEVMPEVIRIENQFRKPGTRLADDLQVYEDMETAGRAQLKSFQNALTAAEKASIRPINAAGAQAVRQGRQTWSAGPQVTQARKAQEWMSWALPARCDTVAETLEARARLMGATLRMNSESAAPAVEAVSAAPPAETPHDRQ